jgi:hypothetical protein
MITHNSGFGGSASLEILSNESADVDFDCNGFENRSARILKDRMAFARSGCACFNK